MESRLSLYEVRVLGCLIEKELATPEYYPLTLNALLAACNQRSNRDPVLDMSEGDVADALEILKMRHWVVRAGESARAAKYRHLIEDRMFLAPPVLAVLAELLLRGEQTTAELRNRASRMAALPDIAAIETALEELRELRPPWVELLERRPGQKEPRWRQLLGVTEQRVAVAAVEGEPWTGPAQPTVERLEAEVATLREELVELRRDFETFKALFS